MFLPTSSLLKQKDLGSNALVQWRWKGFVLMFNEFPKPSAIICFGSL